MIFCQILNSIVRIGKNVLSDIYINISDIMGSDIQYVCHIIMSELLPSDILKKCHNI